MKISQMPPANPLTGSELIEVVQQGQNRQSTISAIGLGRGGGGVIYAIPSGPFGSADTTAAATQANVFAPLVDVEVDQLIAVMDVASSDDEYSMFIAEIDGSGDIQEVVAIAKDPFVASETGPQTYKSDLTSPVTLEAGKIYIFALVLTSGDDSSSARALSAETNGYAMAPIDIGRMLSEFSSLQQKFYYEQNSDAPESGSASSDDSTEAFCIGARIIPEGAAKGRFRGALVGRTTNLTNVTFPVLVPWEYAEYDTDFLWSEENPTRLTVPDGVRRVRLASCVKLEDSSSTGSLHISFIKNGDSLNLTFGSGGLSHRQYSSGFSDNLVHFQSPVLEVLPGDYFEVRINRSGMTSVDQILANAYTWFAMELVQWE